YSSNGVVELTPTLAISGVTYYRHFVQSHIDGNISEFEPCDDDHPENGLCTEEGEELFAVGHIGESIDVAKFKQDFGDTLGSVDKTGQTANSYGVALQASEKAKLFGFGNQLVVGASYDRGEVQYQASSELGFFLPKYVVQGSGLTLTGDG